MQNKDNARFEIDYISTSGVFKTPFTLVIILQLFFGYFVLLSLNLWFYNDLYFLLTGKGFLPYVLVGEWWEWLLLPMNIYGNILLFAFSIILFSAGIFKILNKLCPPKEGIFLRGSKEWKYTHRRFWTVYFPIWLARALPLPWSDIMVYRLLGVRIGRNVVAYEGYIDPQLVEIGDFTMTSLHICIFSHLIYQDKIVIKKVKIGKTCIVGPQTIISPGTILEDGAILGANSYTWLDQHLEGDLIHVGTPVSMTFPIQSVKESLQKAERIKDGKKDIDNEGNKKYKIGGKDS